MKVLFASKKQSTSANLASFFINRDLTNIERKLDNEQRQTMKICNDEVIKIKGSPFGLKSKDTYSNDKDSEITIQQLEFNDKETRLEREEYNFCKLMCNLVGGHV